MDICQGDLGEYCFYRAFGSIRLQTDQKEKSLRVFVEKDKTKHTLVDIFHSLVMLSSSSLKLGQINKG